MKWIVVFELLLILVTTSHQQSCPLDVAVILDNSGRIQAIHPTGEITYWTYMKNFLSDLVGQFNVGTTGRIALVTTGGGAPTVYSQLNTFTSTSDVQNAVQNIGFNASTSDYIGSYNLVATAIMNQGGTGRRAGVPGICFLFVTFPPFQFNAAYNSSRDALKQVCQVIVLGVGSAANINRGFSDAVTNTATDLFRVDDFPSLVNNISTRNAVFSDMTTTCPPTTTTTTTTIIPPTTLPRPTGCANPVDVVFVMDGSGSIDYSNFQHIKSFVANMITNLDIEGGNVRVAMVTFSDNVNAQFGFTAYTDRPSARAAILRTNYTRGTTNTGDALTFVSTDILPTRRSNIPAVVVLITDGGSTDKRAAVRASKAIRLAGVPVIVVAAGTFLPLGELYNLASYPYQGNFIRAFNYTSLPLIQQSVLSTVCNNINECVPSPCKNGAQCVDQYNTYFCTCPSGYSGQNCDKVCKSPTDVLFAISATSSVQPDDFQKEINAVQNLILNTNIQDSRVAFAVFYNQSVEIRVALNQYTTFQNIFDAMSSSYTGGATNLTAVLNVARTQVFTTPNDRGNVPNLLVLFVSGPSQSVTSTFSEAILARTGPSALTIMAVVTGPAVSSNELNAVVSYPTANNIYNLTNIDALAASVDTIWKGVCNDVNECVSSPCLNAGTCTDLINGYSCNCIETATGANCERSGRGVFDIVIGIDTSGSIRNERYYGYVRNFILSVVANMEISASKSRVGVVRWSNISYDMFHLNSYTAKQDVYWAIQQIQFEPGTGGTNTASALQMMKDISFTSAAGDRSNVPNMVLLFTDGNSNINQTFTIPNSVDLKISRFPLYVITFGIGSTNMWELIELASYPVVFQQSYFMVGSGNLMSGELNRYLTAITNDVNECGSANGPCSNGATCINDVKQDVCRCVDNYGGDKCTSVCRKTVDIAFLIDISGAGNFQEVFFTNIQFARAVANGLQLGSSNAASNSLVAVVTFGDGANISYYLGTYNNALDIITAMSFRLSSGSQGLDQALGLLVGNNGVFSSGHNDRSNVPNVAVIITDSPSSSDSVGVFQAAATAKNLNIEIYAVVVGIQPDTGLLNSIVTNTTASPNTNHIFTVSTATNIASVSTNLINALCTP